MQTNMQTIYDSSKCRILLQQKIEPQALELLKSTLWGTSGPLYQHLGTEHKIANSPNPYSFSLHKDGEVIGTCNFFKRKVNVNGKAYSGFYSRYFSIEKQNQGQIYGNLLLKNIKRYFEQNIDEPSVFYAYVDQANARSARLLKHISFDSIRSFETLAFSRIFPKMDKRVARVMEETEKQKVLHLLAEQYKNYVLVNFENVFFEDNYFVLKENDEIVAGLQVNKELWKVRHLPGLSGKMILHVLPHIPIISRLFNPKEFRFAAFEGIYCKQGHERELFPLMESVCAELNLSTGMMWLDADSELYKRLIGSGDWGIIDKLKEKIPATVVAAFKNVSDEEKKAFSENPVYISAFDLT